MWLCERKTATLIGLLIDQIPFKIILAFQLFLVCLFVLSANLTLVQWFLLNCDCVSVVCISSFFTACFYYFLFERYLNSSMTGFLSDILLPFLNSNDLMKEEPCSTSPHGLFNSNVSEIWLTETASRFPEN